MYTIENEKKEAETMNINKFTQKSIEAVNQCEKIAYDYGNQEIDQEHFLCIHVSRATASLLQT